jgi:hypothetical protein
MRNFGKPVALFVTCFHADIVLVLFVDPEDGGGMFFRSICWLSVDCMTLYPRRWSLGAYLQGCIASHPRRM